MSINYLQKQAAEYLNKNEYSQAISIYEQCIAAKPELRFNYWYLGLAFLLQGQEIEAHNVWLSAILNSNTELITTGTEELIKILEEQGNYRLNKKQYNQAEKIYTQILEYDATKILAYENLAYILCQQGKQEEAIVCYQQAILQNPQEFSIYYKLGICYQKNNQLAEAISCYNKVIDLNAEHYEAFNNFGACLTKYRQNRTSHQLLSTSADY